MARSTTISLPKPQEDILRALNRYHFMTSWQVTRLLYRRTSRGYAQDHLKLLVDARYALKLRQMKRGRFGSVPGVWTPSTQGANHLAKQDVTVGVKRKRPDELETPGQLFLDHTLAVNDVLIACALLAREHPAVELIEMRHDRELQRTPTKVTLANGKTSQVIIDGWVDFDVQEQPTPLVFEVDMGTEGQQRWRDKIRGLVAFAGGPYQEAFGATGIRIAVVVKSVVEPKDGETPEENLERQDRIREARKRSLVHWTELELNSLRQREMGVLFRFTSVDPELANRWPIKREFLPSYWFGAPIWQQPYWQALGPVIDTLDDTTSG